MYDVVAAAGTTYVAMHWRAHADHMRDFAVYDGPGGVVTAVRDELAARVDALLAAGVARGPDRARPRRWASPSAPSTTGSCSATSVRCGRWASRCWSV